MDNNKLPKRNELDPQFKWRLEDIYESDALWEEDINRVRKLLKEVVEFKGRLGDSAENLLRCLQLQDEMMSYHDKVFVYARMRRDEDNNNPLYQELAEKALSLNTEVNAAISFITPEITGIPDDRLNAFIEGNSDLALYKTFLNELSRLKKHILSEREEEILALSAEMARNPRDVFTMYNNADIKFPFIPDEDGNEVELTKGRYIGFLQSSNRNVRKVAYEALYKTYGKMKNTLAASLAGNVKKNRFYSIVRKYPSSLEASLDQDNVPIDVYDKLIDTITDNLHLLHRYLRIRKKALKLDELHMYDLYCRIIAEINRKYTWQEAADLVRNGLNPLGNQYIDDLSRGLTEGWIDVY